MNHCDEMTGLLYLDGELEASRADEIRSHAATCAECRELLRALETESVWLRRSLCESLQESLGTEDRAVEESLPPQLLRGPRPAMTGWETRWGAFWGWVAALGLGAGGAYTAWSEFIVPWRSQAALAGFTQGNLLTTFLFSGVFSQGWDAMGETTEFLAMAALGLLAMWLLRRRRARVSAVRAALGALALALAIAPSTRAAEIEHGRPSYTLPAGSEVKTDLIVRAVTTQIDGDVDGDLIVWSKDITVNGHVKGDILAWGQAVYVNGAVDGNVRAACQTLMLDSPVAKNVMALANQVDIEDKGAVGGTMTMAAGNAELGGRVGGDLLAVTGPTEIDGSLGQNAEINSSRLTIGPQARIAGKIRYIGRQRADISPSAKLANPLEMTLRPNRRGVFAPLSYWRRIWRQILKWGASFIFGLALLLLAPGFFLDVRKACSRVMPAIGFGVLFLFATPIAAVIVCITIVGLGVGLTSLVLWAIALYAAHIFVGAWVGERVLPAGAGAGLGGLALGLLILQVIEWVPYLGGWISFLVVLWGVGALALGTYRRLQPQQAIVP